MSRADKTPSYAYYVAYLMPIDKAIRRLPVLALTPDAVSVRERSLVNGKEANIQLPIVLDGRRQVFFSFAEARIALLLYHESLRRNAHAATVAAIQNIAAIQQLEPCE